MESNQGPGIQSVTVNDNPKYEYGNIKERLNLHVKRRLNVQPRHTVQYSSQMPLEVPVFAPIDTSSSTSATQQIQQTPLPKVPRRPYTKRKNKTLIPATSNVSNVQSEAVKPPNKLVDNKKIHDAAGPVVALRKYTKRRNLPVGENNSVVTSNTRANKSTQNNHEAGGGDEDSQDVEVRGRLNESDKRLDILSLVLTLKKRSLMQNPEIQEVIKTLSNSYQT